MNQNIPIVIVMGIALLRQKFIRYIASAEDEPRIIHDEELFMIARVQAHWMHQIDRIVETDFHVRMAAQRISRGIGAQVNQPEHSIHDQPHLYAAIRRIQKRRGDLRSAIVHIV